MKFDDLLNCKKFYENYDLISKYHLEVGKKIVLGKRDDRKCRFCQRQQPEVSFRKKAHALPESTGNKSLFTLYECDQCNEEFGSGIENHFGMWAAPFHVFAQVLGKNGVPTVKKMDDSWRVEMGEDGLQFSEQIDERITDLDFEKKELTVTVIKQTYIPNEVFKAFVKMAMSVIPDEEIDKAIETLNWLRNADKQDCIPNDFFKVFYSFIPGPKPFGNIQVFLFRRKENRAHLPYMTFFIAYANYSFQIVVPFPELDQKVNCSVEPFMTPFDMNNGDFGHPKRRIIDLYSKEKVKKQKEAMVFHYDSIGEEI